MFRHLYQECHHPILKVSRGRLSGGKSSVQIARADVVVHLACPSDPIDSWGLLFREKQRRIFFPIEDGGVPENMMQFELLLNSLAEFLRKGKHVHVQCVGGHGRTGLVLACLLGKHFGVREPIGVLRKKYCKKAVESYLQVRFVSILTGTQERVKPYYPELGFHPFSRAGYSFGKEDEWMI